jgi:hypothetical protein
MEYYFAYAVHLAEEQLRLRCPGARGLAPAMLADFRLDFTFYSPRRGGGTADIVSEVGEKVWGAVYALPAAELAALDKAESAPDIYQRSLFDVRTDSGETYQAWAYQVKQKRGGIQPSEGYLELLLEGAQAWNLPAEYLDFLRTIEPQEEHDHD